MVLFSTLNYKNTHLLLLCAILYKIQLRCSFLCTSYNKRSHRSLFYITFKKKKVYTLHYKNQSNFFSLPCITLQEIITFFLSFSSLHWNLRDNHLALFFALHLKKNIIPRNCSNHNKWETNITIDILTLIVFKKRENEYILIYLKHNKKG